MDNRPRHKVRMARQLRTIINLSKQALAHQMHNTTDTPTTPDFTLHNKTITDINDKTGLNIPQITRWSHEWISDASRDYKVLQRSIDIDTKKAVSNRIQQNINERVKMITTNQRRLISSILERSYRKITVDRLLITDPHTNRMTLLTDPEEIAAEAPKQYTALLTKRLHRFNEMSDEWKEVYRPSPTIDPTWFAHLMDKPSHDEWMSAVRSTSSTSAPELSGIGYRVIKRA